jgi:hypothetical protein
MMKFPIPTPFRSRILSLRTALVLSIVIGPALGAAAPLAAQAILNVERFQMQDVDGFHAGASLSGNASFGNSEVVNLRAEGIVGNRTGRHWPRIIFGGSYLRQRGREAILDNQYAQLRYSYELSPVWSTFHFVQIQRNQTLLLRERQLLGSGVRAALIQRERTAFDLGTGAMLEREVLDREALSPGDEATANVVRMANMAVWTHEFATGARLVNITYFQPRLDLPADFRLLNDLGLRAPVTSVLGLTISGNWRHDSRPPAALRANDIGVNVGLSVDVR